MNCTLNKVPSIIFQAKRSPNKDVSRATGSLIGKRLERAEY